MMACRREGLRQLGERLLAGDLSLDDFVGSVGRSMIADLARPSWISIVRGVAASPR